MRLDEIRKQIENAREKPSADIAVSAVARVDRSVSKPVCYRRRAWAKGCHIAVEEDGTHRFCQPKGNEDAPWLLAPMGSDDDDWEHGDGTT